ncbi:ribonuclease P protein component [Candidatus Saccharibacteria bacterium]|nr:ribonuclease P protein component [Candidatus Saccharibacteria bacterium]
MISRLNRFHGHGSLRYVYQHGHVVRGPLCSLKYVQNDKRKNYRLAVVVSKKVHKSAVRRNRIRRRLYEAFRLQAAAIPPYDMVLTVFHEQIADIPSEELTLMVRAQLKQAGITKLIKK